MKKLLVAMILASCVVVSGCTLTETSDEVSQFGQTSAPTTDQGGELQPVSTLDPIVNAPTEGVIDDAIDQADQAIKDLEASALPDLPTNLEE